MVSCRVFLLGLYLYLELKGGLMDSYAPYQDAKLNLLQGTSRYEVQGQDCPVGISLVRSERFSCACVTGLWAFYGSECAPPIKVIGGLNHCFLMPPLRISQVMLWSNPTHVLDSTLTVLDGDQETVRCKVYRPTHLAVTNASAFVATQSSWTLINQNGSQVCLNVDTGPVSDDQERSGRNSQSGQNSASYCHFSHVSAYIQEIHTFKPGCNKEIVWEVKADRCGRFEEQNGKNVITENVLKSYKVFANFHDLHNHLYGFMKTGNEFLCALPEVLKNYERLPPRKIQQPTNHLPPGYRAKNFSGAKKTVPIEIPEAFREETVGVGWNSERWKKSVLSKSIVPGKAGENKSAPRGEGDDDGGLNATTSRLIPIFIDFPPEDADPPETSSSLSVSISPNEEDATFVHSGSQPNQLVISNLLAYQRQRIMSVLNLPSDDSDPPVDHPQSQVQFLKLLNISKLIMQGTCDLVPPEFFNMAMEVFIRIQRQDLNWTPPVIPHKQFLRILTSLQNCFQRSVPFVFRSTGCREVPTAVCLNATHEVPLKVTKVINSEGFEPLIESVWKMVINAHSYCYADFSAYYNDHHHYTTLLAPIFANGIYPLWFRNCTFSEEYKGIVGDIGGLLRRIDLCVTASRYASKYPWDLTRPNLFWDRVPNAVKRRRRDVRSRKIRVQLPEALEPKKGTLNSKFIFREPTPTRSNWNPPHDLPLPVSGNTENWQWKEDRRIFNGLGFCMKTFDETKTKLGQICL